MTVWDELKARGLIAQVTDEEEIKEMVNNGKATFYIGFDPTADSLHVGHFMALCLMKRLQMAGNRPIALLGGGTGMIGDPSGRSDMRKMMTVETIQHNIDCFKKQMERFIDFSDGKALMVNNADWLMNLNYVEVLRDVGPHFSVNRMLSHECYKQRMERGLTFLEFNYMIMQSYDFYMLYQKYGCTMQFGGDDQWANMLGGTELIRRKLGKDAYAMTITLLLNSEGKKMGKTQSGAVWLDPNKTSPFDFYQYWRNVDDADVIKCMRLLTFLPLEQIDEMAKWEGSQLNKAKEILAYELTNLVHGEEEAKKAQEGARALFAGGADTAHMPTTELTDEDFSEEETIDLISMLVKTGRYPLAYIISKYSEKVQSFLILMVTIPMWINMLLRTYAWMNILSDNGLVNNLLKMLGISPITMMYTDFSVIVGLVCNFMPFMIIPIHTSLSKMDKSLIEAANDLGANPFQTFWRITWKLSMPGVVNGIMMVFLLSISTFVIPKLLGGGQYMLIGNLIESQFISVGDWNFGSAISLILAVIILIFMSLMKKMDTQDD